jgi:hypothetical protein
MRGRLTQLRRKDGSLVSVVTSALVVRDHGGVPRYVIARATPAEAMEETAAAPADVEAAG